MCLFRIVLPHGRLARSPSLSLSASNSPGAPISERSTRVDDAFRAPARSLRGVHIVRRRTPLQNDHHGFHRALRVGDKRAANRATAAANSLSARGGGRPKMGLFRLFGLQVCAIERFCNGRFRSLWAAALCILDGERIDTHQPVKSAGGFVTILAEVGEQTSCGGPHHPLFSLPLALGIHIDEKLHLAG